ncbi:hypothetical protein ES705_02264 [subsurface metagenome]|nr:methyltransferase domain-containing protein [Clostridia bacterium]
MSKETNVRFWKNLIKSGKSKNRAKINFFINWQLLLFIKQLMPSRLRTIYRYIIHPSIIWWYFLHPKIDRYSYYDHPEPELVFAALKVNELPVTELVASDYLFGFQEYLQRNRNLYMNMGYFDLFVENGYFPEKALEHYLSLELLEVCNGDIVLDVGAWGSPFAVIAERIGCNAFSQDLIFENGVHGKKIGSDVRAIPMPDASFTKIVAHCAIDNFEGDADSEFIREAWRLLKPGGMLLIIPLHMATRFENIIDPFEKDVETDTEAIKVYKPMCGFRFGRHYDVNHLQMRLLDIAPFRFQIVYFKNGFQTFHSSCHLKFALKLIKDRNG